jgi:hypothetical protein
VEESSHSLIFTVLSQHFHGRTEENHKKNLIEILVSCTKWKDVEGSSYGPFKVLFQHLSQGTGEKQEKSQRGELASRLKNASASF